ncbi:MAG: hypothetical protein Wins2KO_23390 [Winogradskyella sp.]
MLGKLYRLFVLFAVCTQLHSQTTDLSIAIEAQNLSGTSISQIEIFQDFQYLITVSNSGNSVNDTSISIDFDNDLTVNSFASQNNTNGASEISNIDITDNVLTATIANMPNNSSVELLVIVTAPSNLGGIAANGTVNPPNGTTDTNTSNNQSIISIDVLDVLIDFTVTHQQIQPSPGTAIGAWGDQVNYHFTITNNSVIDYPLASFETRLVLDSPIENGQPFAEAVTLTCIESTNGTSCPDLTDANSNTLLIDTELVPQAPILFSFDNAFVITSGGSITFEMVYVYNNSSCSLNQLPISVNSFIQINLDHSNASSNTSNFVTTNLITADLCPQTDVCIETIQTNPDLSVILDYGDQITFITTACNNGPLDAEVQFFMQNLNANAQWQINSVNCVGTTGAADCTDFFITENGQLWFTNDFIFEVNSTITIETIVEYIEPPCDVFPNQIETSIKSEINLISPQFVDTNPDNNLDVEQIILPPQEPCDVDDIYDLIVTKTQTNPQLPNGSSTQNTAEWGEITYEITVTNNGPTDEPIRIQDHMPVPTPNAVPMNASLTSVQCISTTGTATCFNINNANIGVVYDGITEDGTFDTFWEILPEDNWILPTNSSVTFEVTVDWQPECSQNNIRGINVVRVNYVNTLNESNLNNNNDEVITYFAPCIDLVVQTYPEFTQVDTGQTFNWIVDISNSITSSTATNTIFENLLNDAFTISGSITCDVIAGNATCSTSFNTTGNFITGIIPSMDAGSTVRITIPVIAPNYGGAFNNIAEAAPSAADNEELTPDTNISINSVQVISPTLEKEFIPNTIIEGAESELIFTIFNIASNLTQNDISFTDTLPSGVILSGVPAWISANGCTANFIGGIGDDFVGVTDLTFPDGVASCAFSVMVTAENAGAYLNNFSNFSDTNNLDASQTSATLTVIVDPSNVDIEILKTVEPTEVDFGDEVTFTITATNLGTTTGTGIEIIDQLPAGYEFISSTTSVGTFDDTTLSWLITNLNTSESGTLTIVARVISSDDLLNVALLNGINEVDRDLSNNEDTAEVEVSNCLFIPEGVSPNNDTKNDFLIIPCIEDYEENNLKIFNRYGTLVYQTNNYKNEWDGRANMGFPSTSNRLPVGTYFYILEVDGFDKPFQGYIYLNY